MSRKTESLESGHPSFSITGSTKAGQILTINKSSSDPDCDDGNYSYQWQSSSDGINWQDTGDKDSTYTIRALDLGNKIRAQISCSDTKGFQEKVITDVRNIHVPVSLNNVETFGSYILAKTNNGDGYIASAGTEDFTPLTDKNGNPLGDNSYVGWKLVGADTVDGINRTAWKHDTYGFFFHKHDENWQEIPGGSSEADGFPAFYKIETSFDQDLDDDGFTGISPAISELISNGCKKKLIKEFEGKEAVIAFLEQCRKDPIFLSKFEFKNCLELILHVKTVGYFTTENDWRLVIGPMEYFIVTEKDKEEFGPNSKLWPRMYGKTFLRYIVEIFSSLDQHEKNKLFLS